MRACARAQRRKGAHTVRIEQALGDESRELRDLLVDVVPAAALDRVVRLAPAAALLVRDGRPAGSRAIRHTERGQARGRTDEWTAREQIADGRTCVRDERARKKEARRRAGSTHCFAAMSSGGVSPPFCMPTIPMPGTFTSLGLTPSPTLPRLVPPLNALKPENGKKQNNNAHSTHKALHTETARETHRAPTRAWGGRIRYPGRWA